MGIVVRNESIETENNFAGHTHLRAKKMKRSQWKRKIRHQVRRSAGNTVSF